MLIHFSPLMHQLQICKLIRITKWLGHCKTELTFEKLLAYFCTQTLTLTLGFFQAFTYAE